MNARTPGILVLVSVLLHAALSSPVTLRAASPSPTPAHVDFAKEILPIFEERCFECHGPKKEESAMRADSRESLLKGGDNGPSIVPGNSANSILVQVLTGTHETIAAMPKKKKKLSADQIALIRAWIDQGAVWESAAVASKRAYATNHWAFIPPLRPSTPTVVRRSWTRDPIDAFVAARLEKEGLRPSPEADKAILLRRLSLDLIGLPPTPAELDAFLSDRSSDAYERQVDRLLASPHYGERWGRHWLDAARYADTDGYEKDKTRFVWFYRDWVVNALNQDMPYDQFIVRQIAGDELPNATQDDVVATGFLRNSMLNEEGAIDPEQFRMEAMFDRMDAIGKSVLGVTIQCAQCHNHKFDPISQEEYYRLFAFLNNDNESSPVVYTPSEQMKADELRRKIHEIEARLQHGTPDWGSRMDAWGDATLAAQPKWTTAAMEFQGEKSERYFLQNDGSFLAQGYAPTKSSPRWRSTNQLSEIRGFRLDLLNDDNLPRSGPGRSIFGTAGLTEFEVDVAPLSDPGKRTRVKLTKAVADVEMPETPLPATYDDKSNRKRVLGPASYALDGKDETAWSFDNGAGRRNQPHAVVFQAETNVAFPGGTVVDFIIRENHGGNNSDDNQNNNVGRFRISVSSGANAADQPALPDQVLAALKTPARQRTPGQKSVLFTAWRTTVPAWSKANAEIDALHRGWPEGTTQLTLTPREGGRTTSILRRGDWLKPADPVTAAFPSVLNPPPANAGNSRLTLAKWLVDRQSPTTARVFVNRIWQAYFGRGIVSTPEDFGTQSPPPSHPELLDWLAVEFMEHGWSIKHIQRLIVTSATYRQSSRVSPALLERDPLNDLLARSSRFRVDSEIVRDIALASSGLLSETLGGPPIYPPIPEFMNQPPVSYGPFPWHEAQGKDRYRRGLYVFRRRNQLHPSMSVFDAPTGDFSCVRRSRSDTPLQALTTLNETIFNEAARALALRSLQSGGTSDDDRISFAFRCVTSRAPSRTERADLRQFLERQKTRLADGWLDIRKLGAIDGDKTSELPSGTTPNQLAAYTALSRVLLNLDETLTRE
jgi:mono/diheme cytochrome c family protein